MSVTADRFSFEQPVSTVPVADNANRVMNWRRFQKNFSGVMADSGNE
jgi:hypothetical protein